MIISHSKKFIFLRTIKTASSSLEIFLSQFCDKDDILTKVLLFLYRIFYTLIF